MNLHPNLNLPFNKTCAFMQRVQGDIGVELEIEGRGLPTMVGKQWNVKQDTSLRNGLEYTTPGATSVAGLRRAMLALNEKFTAEATRVIPSTRCSTHIHLNFQDELLRTYLGFMIVAAIVEPVLLRICGPERNGNVFCMPMYETGDLVQHIDAFVKWVTGYDPAHGRFGPWPERGKYASFNTNTLAGRDTPFGSIEARVFPMSIDTNTVVQWAEWVMTMREVARGTEDYGDLIASAIRNPRGFVQRVLANADLDQLCLPASVEELVQLGAETAYEMYRAARPVLFWDPTAKKKAKAAPAAFEAVHDDGFIEEEF